MFRNTRCLTPVMLSMLIFILIGHPSTAKAEYGVSMLIEYVDQVVSGNYESAMYYWTEESQERSTRFGIEYIDIPLKIDCSSPLVRDPQFVHDVGPWPVKEETRLTTDEYTRFTIKTDVESSEAKHHYYTRRFGDYFALIYPQDYYSQNWPTVQTEYLSLRYDPQNEKYLNEISLKAVDRFIERVADEIDLPDDALELLEKEKLNYFFSASEAMVKDMSGFAGKGMYDLASDDIISSFFPHYHELTHFLVTLKLRRLHLYSLPLMREGVAVCYGGRWGKDPRAMLSLGAILQRENIVQLDSILSMSGFANNAGSDLAYPVAGLFDRYLIDRIGVSKFFDLYRSLSGGFERVNALTNEDIQQSFVDAVGKNSWMELREDFEVYAAEWLEQDAGVFPGTVEDGEVVYEDGNVSLKQEGEWYALTAVAPSSEPNKGNVVFDLHPGLNGKGSTLFSDQYLSDLEFEGYRFGIRYDQNEVGVYDYATNQLLAKYIWGMTPSEDYYNESENKLTFKFHRDVLERELSAGIDYKRLSE